MSPEGEIYNFQADFIGKANTNGLKVLSQNDNDDKPDVDGVEE